MRSGGRRSAALGLRAPGLLVALLMAPATALAQDEETPPGSLTVVSRPANVAVEISGDRSIVGRTPFTLERGLTGRYRVRSVEPGYETWRRTIVLDGASADTLWMTLRPKTPLMAGLRSLVFPGWGQAYSTRPTAAWTYLAAGVGAGGVALWMHLEYEDRVDEYRQATTNTARRQAAERAEEAYGDRRVAVGVAAAVWGVNVLDAMVFFPRRQRPSPVGLEMRHGLDGEAGMALVVRTSF